MPEGLANTDTVERDFVIERRGAEWCVTSEDGSRDLGCYPSEDQARERLRQIEAAKAARHTLHNLDDDLETALGYAVTKTEDGKSFPAGDFAFVPDPNKPSTWKLRLTSTPGGPPDPRIVGAAAAALGAGFRGQTVDLPSGVRASVIAKVRSAWRKAHPDMGADQMPPALKRMEDDERPREYARLSGIEIFRSGTWNGDSYTERDLDEIVAAFENVGYRVPIKLGHKENSGDPSYGWVESIRRVGDRLIADFADLPDKLYGLIKDRRYDSVSSEIFWNLKRGEQTFRRALKAVALLGAEIPAVAGLKPLREAFEVNALEADCHIYQIGTKELSAMTDQKKPDDKAKGDDQQVDTLTADLAKAQEQIKTLTAKLEERSKDDSAVQIAELQETVKSLKQQTEQAQERERQTQIQSKVEKISVPAFRSHFAALYDLATSVEPTKTVKFTVYDDKAEANVEKDTNPVAVIDDLAKRVNKHSEKLFREFGDAGDFRRDGHPVTEDPGQEIDRLVRAYRAKKPEASYQEALDAVRADPENRELVAAYARS